MLQCNLSRVEKKGNAPLGEELDATPFRVMRILSQIGAARREVFGRRKKHPLLHSNKTSFN